MWAPYWYDSVWRSTGFTVASGASPGARVELPASLEPLADQCTTYYERLASYKLKF